VKDIIFFRLGGLPCGVCGWPALCSEIYSNGVVGTVHRDRGRRSCRSLLPSMSNNRGKGGLKATLVRPPAVVSLVSLAVADRSAA
jgi:hypothetical protein